MSVVVAVACSSCTYHNGECHGDAAKQVSGLMTAGQTQTTSLQLHQHLLECNCTLGVTPQIAAMIQDSEGRADGVLRFSLSGCQLSVCKHLQC